MLIQSYNGYIEIFPALPKAWNNVSFHHLRTEGAFLVSAQKENGVATEVTVTAEQDNTLVIQLPFKTWLVTGINRQQIDITDRSIVTVYLKKGQTIVFKNGYE
jgi:alpha-L-fucosidase 2